jgi:hypothetical protein
MASSKKYSVQYCDKTSILIINSRGIIRLLHTPFKVQCCQDVGRFKTGSIVYVEEVSAGEKDELIYLIGEGAYFHKHFRIIANF